MLIVLETEIWPNLYAEAKRAGASLAIVNGRISNRSWPRYRRWRKLFSPVLKLPDAVFVQSAADRDRYSLLGVPDSKLHIAGNLKYDVPFSREGSDIERFGADAVWIAASTVGPNERGSLRRHSIDEDDIVIRAFQSLTVDFPRLLLILAPRQPARFSVVAQKLESSGVRFIRRTAMKADSPVRVELPGVLLLDTIGELSGCYSLADAVFVGGSIAPRGGHNIIEPAASGVPIVVGPHMENFEAITGDFLDAEAIIQISREEELLPAIRDLLINQNSAKAVGARARQVVEARRGVSQRLAAQLWHLYNRGDYKSARGFFARTTLSILAAAWRKGGAIKRRHAERHALFVISASGDCREHWRHQHRRIRQNTFCNLSRWAIDGARILAGHSHARIPQAVAGPKPGACARKQDFPGVYRR